MSTQDVAKDLVALCRAMKFEECGEKYWADDVVSAEPGGPPGMDPVAKGKAAVQAKGKWWSDNHETHSVEVGEPCFNGDQFIVSFKMDVTAKANGQRMQLEEMALYTLKNDKIVEERFFMGARP